MAQIIEDLQFSKVGFSNLGDKLVKNSKEIGYQMWELMLLKKLGSKNSRRGTGPSSPISDQVHLFHKNGLGLSTWKETSEPTIYFTLLRPTNWSTASCKIYSIYHRRNWPPTYMLQLKWHTHTLGWIKGHLDDCKARDYPLRMCLLSSVYSSKDQTRARLTSLLSIELSAWWLWRLNQPTLLIRSSPLAAIILFFSYSIFFICYAHCPTPTKYKDKFSIYLKRLVSCLESNRSKQWNGKCAKKVSQEKWKEKGTKERQCICENWHIYSFPPSTG